MDLLIYLAVAVLVLWSVVYLVRHIRRQLHGECGCHSGCGGDCSACHRDCRSR